MFETEVTVAFEFSHHLEGFDIRFAKEHQHTWNITVTIATPDVDWRGVGVDFVKLKQELATLLAPYQNKLLNESDLPFCSQPTAEHIALWVADKMSYHYPHLIKSVTVGTVEERARFIVPQDPKYQQH